MTLPIRTPASASRKQRRRTVSARPACARNLVTRPVRRTRRSAGHPTPGSCNGHTPGRLAQRGVGVNTTFYFQDNAPELAYLKFVKGGHLSRPPGLERRLFTGYETNEFRDWCDRQEHVVLYPKAGDCVLFYSHIPHQGEKIVQGMERSNVVCLYQVTPIK